MTDKIYLKGVRAYGYVGLLPEENVLGQWFEVDATMWVDFEAASLNDRLEDTLDYRASIRKIEHLIQTSKFKLIERLAGAIAESLLEDPKIEQVQLRVIKHPPIPNFQGSVAVEVVRCQKKDSEKNEQKERELVVVRKEIPEVKPAIASSSTPNSSTQITSIHTDGACSKNPGPGGWGVVVHFGDGSVKELGGGTKDTTNNQMEMQAAIAALEFYAKQGQTQPITLYTDSKYVIDGITKWIKGWKKNGWQTKDNKPVKNQELWQILDRLNSSKIQWEWVQGHSGDPDNERCDEIARSYSTSYSG
ncbi:ribonuclease HI [Tumidithrix elongata RA019]|uniref:Ribonuclease H n=1 Tax=Tumidithrix elongata BACA0141 TaxID=2716417 RepID=A0AAW9Q0I9_9CYAN|nr:ribonuclease HI [Tumidithrix elongata RA019]